MAISTAMCTSFKQEILVGTHNFTATTGNSATITANGALIYNSSASNKAVCALAFGGDKTSTAGDFTVQFPTADASNAIIRIA